LPLELVEPLGRRVTRERLVEQLQQGFAIRHALDVGRVCGIRGERRSRDDFAELDEL
jgi:hypothetical protein